MIDIVSGQVASIDKSSLVIMVGGVGLRVNVPRNVFDTVHGAGETVLLYTHLAVREDALTLYGFSSEEDRVIFETLIAVSGIGPKLALSVLSAISVDYLRRAVTTEDPLILTRVP